MVQVVAALVGMAEVYQKSRINPMSEVTTVERYAGYLELMNTGAMKSLQMDPDNPDGDCLTLTEETNALIQAMFNSDNYTNGVINQAEF